jgi:hypothetical protein
MSARDAQRGLVLVCAASAGIHAALVPTHAGEAGSLGVGVGFAVSSVALGLAALAVDRNAGRTTVGATAAFLASLLAAYAVTRVVAVPPISHVEAVDAIGVATKLLETAGLVLALRLLRVPAGMAKGLPAVRTGAGP